MKKILISALLLLLAVPALAQDPYLYHCSFDSVFTTDTGASPAILWISPAYFHGGASGGSFTSISTNRVQRATETGSTSGKKHPALFTSELTDIRIAPGGGVIQGGAATYTATPANWFGRVRFVIAAHGCDTTGFTMSFNDPQHILPDYIDSVGVVLPRTLCPTADTTRVVIHFNGRRK